ncbi:uncharacterized protein BCR38DRAFT_340228 [Pseudomassariella vexata]|uniref:Uncharacterized protein n=1 Tax=Pseudomassariella vexata TaxID=1141098 RepID=A0A1Y2E383_9PEZI|nr:uncharacterized protein BCR38DRAFT_340228 [Pseudomassariella vexata]ORY65776.1 hypothetical protein BCR38DRAFT_340228 [Pseudomassariella vexata]
MVARTSVLNSLKKGLLPQIHHPLPLNRRESQQLLKQITTSFRKNLDKEHPWQPSETPSPSRHDHPTGNTKDTTQKHHPTDLHLESILSNPLFSHPRHDPVALNRAAPRHNPTDVFDHAVSRGMMTPRRAAGFLAAVKLDIEKSSTLDIEQGMAASGAGLRVVKWLRASGLENRVDFLSVPYSGLMRVLVPFLQAEGLQEIVWTWISRLGVRLATTQVDEQAQLLMAQLLARTVIGSSMTGEGLPLDTAYSSIIRANQTLPMENLAVANHVKTNWLRLSWKSTVEAWKHPKPSAPLFDLFVDMGRPFRQQLDLAHLELLHPSNPDHSSAVNYLHDNGRIARAVEKAKANSSSKYPTRMIVLGTDTVSRLKEVGQNDEASWVKEFISKTFFAWNSNTKLDPSELLDLRTKTGLPA